VLSFAARQHLDLGHVTTSMLVCAALTPDSPHLPLAAAVARLLSGGGVDAVLAFGPEGGLLPPGEELLPDDAMAPDWVI
ncbi:hypothetical protein, partial [Sphingomonas bacterium]|uniref:hypothetical protein n=1 Tax=Sphingomonas bacterium TaxID=1895847 RepID=UPI00157762B3